MSSLFYNNLKIVGSETDLKAMSEAVTKSGDLLSGLVPPPPNLSDEEFSSFVEEQWGCRDVVYEFFGSIESGKISFDSLRFPPVQAILNVSKNYPQAEFTLGYILEEEMVGGIYEIRDGEIINEKEFEEDEVREYAGIIGYYFDDDEEDDD